MLLAAILIGAGSLWYTSRLVGHIEDTERQKMELWAEATRIVIGAPLESELAFPFSVIESNTHIPVILTDSTGEILGSKEYRHNQGETPGSLYAKAAPLPGKKTIR